jgi:hypothetical protein
VCVYELFARGKIPVLALQPKRPKIETPRQTAKPFRENAKAIHDTDLLTPVTGRGPVSPFTTQV